jgi:DNA repair protein RadC
MEETQEQRTRPKRLLKAGTTLKPYSVPRYRIALVCEQPGSSVSEPIQTSTTAAALLRPCFDGLDREQFVICGSK